MRATRLVLMPFVVMARLTLAAGADELLNRWSVESTTVDCPMTPTEARALQSAHGGAFDRFAADIGCACTVNVEAGITSRPTCRVGESIAAFERENLASQREALMDQARAQRAAGVRGSISAKPTVSPEAQRLIDWVTRLKASADLPADKVSRKVPLNGAKDAPVLLGRDEELSKTFQALARDFAQLKQSADGQVWALADTYLHAMRTDLENHERITLNGKSSAAGRAMLADAEKRMKAGAQQLAATRRMEGDPEFTRLEAREGKLADERKAFEKLWGVSVSVGCSTGKPGACELAKRTADVDQGYRALHAKYGVKGQN